MLIGIRKADFETMGFGLARPPDMACLKCGVIVRCDLGPMHLRSHLPWWRRWFSHG